MPRITPEEKLDRMLDRREAARLRVDERAAERLEHREREAEKMIGELNSGKCYVYPAGGKYREGTRGELIRFLIRNRYV